MASDHTVTAASLARCLEVGADEADAALREFEADLLGADRGIQLRRHPHGVRVETKRQYTELIGRPLPERQAKPITAQALKTLWRLSRSSSRSRPATSTPSAASKVRGRCRPYATAS